MWVWVVGEVMVKVCGGDLGKCVWWVGGMTEWDGKGLGILTYLQ